MAVGGAEREPDCLSRLVQGHPGEEPQLHDLGGLGISPAEAVEGVVEREEVLIRRPGGVIALVEIDPALPASSLQPGPVAAVVDEEPRIASAAAPKKWARPSKCGSPTKRS